MDTTRTHGGSSSNSAPPRSLQPRSEDIAGQISLMTNDSEYFEETQSENQEAERLAKIKVDAYNESRATRGDYDSSQIGTYLVSGFEATAELDVADLDA